VVPRISDKYRQKVSKVSDVTERCKISKGVEFHLTESFSNLDDASDMMLVT
jgi:hypothetical protein